MSLPSEIIDHQQSTAHRWRVQPSKVMKNKYLSNTSDNLCQQRIWKIFFFALCRAKIISTTLALRTTKYLSKETDYIPWESALRNLNYFILMFDRTEVYGALQVKMTLLLIRKLILIVILMPVETHKGKVQLFKLLDTKTIFIYIFFF